MFGLQLYTSLKNDSASSTEKAGLALTSSSSRSLEANRQNTFAQSLRAFRASMLALLLLLILDFLLCSLNSRCFIVQMSSCCLSSVKLGRERKPQLPTTSRVTSDPLCVLPSICSMRSVYRLFSKLCAASYPVSKHTVSSMTQTSCTVSLHTTMSGLWSVVAMWRGNT